MPKLGILEYFERKRWQAHQQMTEAERAAARERWLYEPMGAVTPTREQIEANQQEYNTYLQTTEDA